MRIYAITTQKRVRELFWAARIPGTTKKKIANYRGDGLMHNTDTRQAFVDFVDSLCRDGQISSELAQRVTL